ncbi:MAG: hypothetical protein NWQ47_01160 [Crocinitomicaceae bacterium]|jgi:hypothetical protein|nr:hypothetical protein [Crocinitomicaceae bacterium]MDP5009820.1 hypothetical protein [Crocinitomicaceae bacterium]
MIRIILVVICLAPLFSMAQKPIELKKKFFGTYAGEISSFKLDTGEDLVDVDKTVIKINIEQDSIQFNIGRNELASSYTVLFEAAKYYVLDCKVNGRLAGERIVVYKKGKKISRDGLFPQPNALLYLVK